MQVSPPRERQRLGEGHLHRQRQRYAHVFRQRGRAIRVGLSFFQYKSGVCQYHGKPRRVQSVERQPHHRGWREYQGGHPVHEWGIVHPDRQWRRSVRGERFNSHRMQSHIQRRYDQPAECGLPERQCGSRGRLLPARRQGLVEGRTAELRQRHYRLHRRGAALDDRLFFADRLDRVAAQVRRHARAQERHLHGAFDGAVPRFHRYSRRRNLHHERRRSVHVRQLDHHPRRLCVHQYDLYRIRRTLRELHVCARHLHGRYRQAIPWAQDAFRTRFKRNAGAQRNHVWRVSGLDVRVQ